MKPTPLACPLKDSTQPELLLDYVARRLDARMAEALEDHAADCEPCQHFIADQSVVWQQLDQFAAAEVSAGFNRELYKHLVAEDRAPWWARAWRHAFATGEPGAWRPAVALSAACAVVFAIALVRVPGLVRTTPAGYSGSPVAGSAVQKAAPAVETPDVESAEKALEDIEMLQVVDGKRL